MKKWTCDELELASNKCTHPKCTPAFDEEAAKGLDAAEIQRRWPRFDGVCPDCGERMIIYASFMQYIAGDY